MFAEILGPDGLIVVVVVALVLLFGASSLPKLARGLGSAQHEFRKGLSDGATEAPSETSSEPADPGAARK